MIALRAALDTALEAGDDWTAVKRVCRVLTDALPCEAGAVTIMNSDLERQTVFASDGVIKAFELAQYTLGEGPTLLAFTSGRPVIIPDTAARAAGERWPGLARAVADLPMGAIFCFPMRLGVLQIGVCALYQREPGQLRDDQVSLALDAIELTTLTLLQLRGQNYEENLVGRWLAVDGLSRRIVYQAIGVLMVQLDVSAETAFARLRAHSFVTELDIEQVAEEVVRLRLRLDNDGP